MKFLLITLITSLFLSANMTPLVKADAFDLSDQQGDYLMIDTLSLSEELVPKISTDTLSQMSDQEIVTLIDSVMDDLITNPQVVNTLNLEDASSLSFISLKENYLVTRELQLDSKVYSTDYYLNQNDVYNNRVAKFNRLRSYLSHGEDIDDRFFFVFHEGKIYIVDITELSAARYEALDLSKLPPQVILPELRLPTNDEYSLLAYDIDKEDYQPMTYSELSALEENGPELILLTGDVIDYNHSYIDYSEGQMLVSENNQTHGVILRFFRSPLEPLEVGDKLKVYGQLIDSDKVLANDDKQLSILVQWIEALE